MVIYEIVNSVNGKKYIGKHVGDVSDGRWYGHTSTLNKNKHSNCHLQHAWNKYGADNFQFNTIESDILTIDELNLREVFYIKKYKTMDDRFGYNLREGGTGGRLSEESKRKLSKSLLEGYRTGRIVTWNRGISRTDEEKLKMSLTRVKRWEEGKIISWNVGKPWSKKMKKKISESLVGRTLDDKHKLAIAKGGRPQPYPEVISPDGTTYQFENLSDFCREHNLVRGTFQFLFSNSKSRVNTACGGWRIK